MTITLQIDSNGVATVMLDRPDKHNALTAEMIAGLTDVARQLAADTQIRIVVLAGQGPTFCAGGDLHWMADQVSGGMDQRRAGITALSDMLLALYDLPQPLIGRVQGDAYGTGCALLSVCDAAIGVDDAHFGINETKLGLTPGVLSPFILAKIGGAAGARLMMSSRGFDATEALGMQLLSRMISGSDLDQAVAAEVDPYLHCAPNAVRATKRQLRKLGPQIDVQTIQHAIADTITDWDGPEVAAGIAAFFAKQPAPWAK